MNTSDVRTGVRERADDLLGAPARAGSGAAGTYGGILHGHARPAVAAAEGERGCFSDLNLDQVLDRLVAGRESYDLRPLFRAPAGSAEEVRYRQQVVQDLGDEVLVGRVTSFANGMRSIREHLATARKLRHPYQRADWVMEAAATYCTVVREFAEDLSASDVRAPGWLGLRDYLAGYIRSAGFEALDADVQDVRNRLAHVSYCVRIRGGYVSVSRYEQQPDYSAEVLATFAKFRQGDVAARTFRISRFLEMNDVETRILDRVAQLHPDAFSALAAFVDNHREFVDATVATFDREVQFYLGYLKLIAPLQVAGLPFCQAEVHPSTGEVQVRDTFDLALALKLVEDKRPVVGNDVDLSGAERIVVVSGPNQGGKTTLARTVGQLHHLAALGLPIPGRTARLPLVDRIFTQFERGEDMTDLTGKLADDLTRVRAVLEQATEHSLVVVNELFTSTTLEDARFLGRQVLEALIELQCVAVYVTFVDELSEIGPEVVSMVSQVDPEDPARRTFEVVRRRADGLAYADVLAARYGLTPDGIAARVRP